MGRKVRTNVVVDETLVRKVMDRFGLRTKREAIDFALRRVAGDDRRDRYQKLLDLEGSGWHGDLDEMRGGKIKDL
jgi:Arc/MetJ family transcription regulator